MYSADPKTGCIIHARTNVASIRAYMRDVNEVLDKVHGKVARFHEKAASTVKIRRAKK